MKRQLDAGENRSKKLGLANSARSKVLFLDH